MYLDLKVEDDSAVPIVRQTKVSYNTDVRNVMTQYEDPKSDTNSRRSPRDQSSLKVHFELAANWQKFRGAKLEEIREKYREKLLKTCKSIDHCLKVAKTCYTVTYQSQKEQQSNTEPVHKKQSALSFAWLFDDYLNLAKNIRKAEKIDFLRFAQLVDRGFAITVTRVPMKRSE